MTDPFADRSNKQLYREAQVWMAVFTCLLTAFLYLVVKRMTGSGDDIPEHILRSGVAQIEPSQNEIELKADSSLAEIELPKLKLPQFGNIPRPPQRKLAPVSDLLRASETWPPVQQIVSDAPEPSSSFPEPSDVAVAKIDSIADGANTVDQETESKGQQRARELEKIANSLPDRLEQLQSKVKQASAILDVAEEKHFDENSKIAQNEFPPLRKLPTKVGPVVSLPSQHDIKADHEDENSFDLGSIKSNNVLPAKDVAGDRPRSESVAPLRIAGPDGLKGPNELSAFQASNLQQRKALAGQPSIESAVSSDTQDRLRTLTSSPNTLASKFPKMHEVVWGDSFFSVAQKYYDDGRWFKALYLANQNRVEDFDSLPQGTRLTIPSTESLARQFPEFSVAAKTSQVGPDAAEKRVYITKANDTLFDIARRKLGQGSRFFEIIQRNEFRLPKNILASDSLPPNLRLVLPESPLK